MLVTIIVPVYNSELFLNECIDSIVNQTYKNTEILLINDGSTDNSLNICKKYSEQYDNVRVITQENNGVSSARNRGIREANGKYIAFVDADDFVESTYIEEMLNAKTDDSDMVICRYNRFVKNSKVAVTEKFLKSTVINDDNFRNMIKYYFSKKDNIHGTCCRCLFDTAIIKELSFDEMLKHSEDLLMLFQYFTKISQIKVLDRYLYNYRDNIGSAENTYKSGLLEQSLIFVKEVEPILIDFIGNKKSRKVLKTYRAALCERCIRNEFKNRQSLTQNIREIKKSELYKDFKFRKCFKMGGVRAILGYLKTWFVSRMA